MMRGSGINEDGVEILGEKAERKFRVYFQRRLGVVCREKASVFGGCKAS